MELIEGFEEQIQGALPVTKEMLGEENFMLEYSSGKKKKVGDTVLFGFLLVDQAKKDISMEMIQVHPDEIGVLYEVDHTMSISMSFVPALKKITASK